MIKIIATVGTNRRSSGSPVGVIDPDEPNERGSSLRVENNAVINLQPLSDRLIPENNPLQPGRSFPCHLSSIEYQCGVALRADLKSPNPP
jgi:hypothetical protein